MTRSPFATAYLRRRYAILFHTLLLTLGAAPVIGAVGLDTRLLELLLAVSLLAAVLPFGTWRSRWTLLLILAAALALRVGMLSTDEADVSTASVGVMTVVALLAAAGAFRFALRSAVVSSEHVYAALSAYLLAGTFFGVFYWVLEHFVPGSLLAVGEGASAGFSMLDGIYFSFVTLATLGYGDVLPHGDVARGFAVVEAVAGQLYLAVLVARLVSSYVAAGRKDGD